MLKKNKAAIIESIYNASLTPELFQRFTQFIQERSGIHLIPSKQSMLEGRLRKRMRQLMLPTFEHYARYLFDHTGTAAEELINFLDVITTNKTGFFREEPHLDYLTANVLPKFLQERKKKPSATFRIWSAGCSTGEEAYSLAIVLNEFAEKNPAFSYAMLATDLSRRALETAKAGVYAANQLENIPPVYRHKYFPGVRTEDRKQVRVVSKLRTAIMFRRLNLTNATFPIKEPVQAIFCRNVMMYFDRTTRGKIISRFIEKLVPGGYLFTGHSESLTGFPVHLKPVSNSVYQKKQR